MAPQTQFWPRVHGYQFQDVSIQGYGPGGRSGGMAWSALDFYYHRDRRTPGYDNASFPDGVLVPGWTPGPKSTLSGYIARRQADATVAESAVHDAPDNKNQFTLVKALLDATIPIPLVHADGPGAAHHVVAFAHQTVNGFDELVVYDPAVDRDVLLRVISKTQVDRFTAHPVGNGPWVVETQLSGLDGFWLAKGYKPQKPDAVEDISSLYGIKGPAAAVADCTFDVSFDLVNLGEFDTPVFQTGILVDDVVVGVQPYQAGSSIPPGRALIGQDMVPDFQIQVAELVTRTARQRHAPTLRQIAPRQSGPRRVLAPAQISTARSVMM